MAELTGKRPLQSVKKFYFLDYFYILLKSVEKYSEYSAVFDSFKNLKYEHHLGESKYKKLTVEVESPTEAQQKRYEYTFKQVIEESIEYGLIKEIRNPESFSLTTDGRELLGVHERMGLTGFNLAIFKLMEDTYEAFHILVDFMYEANPKGAGLLIFPHYSPRKLGLRRQRMRTSGDFRSYSDRLVRQLQADIKHYLKRDVKLDTKKDELLDKLTSAGLLPARDNEPFDLRDYNRITKRIRDFWIGYFLKDLYKFPHPMMTFDFWTYRGKQIGVIHATEIYPFFSGKLVYPTSVVLDRTNSQDFRDVYKYNDGRRMFLHAPRGDAFQEDFVDTLLREYLSLRRVNPNYFISLVSLRETVCYSLKISWQTFGEYLDKVYRLNLLGQLRIRIALEVDKLPEETKATYLKQEPVKVHGSYRNIIAIDVTKGEENRVQAITKA